MTNSFELALRMSVGIGRRLSVRLDDTNHRARFLAPQGWPAARGDTNPAGHDPTPPPVGDRQINRGRSARSFVAPLCLSCSSINLIPDFVPVLGYAMTQSSLLPSSVLWSGGLDLTPFGGNGPARPMDSQACGDSRDSMVRLSENDLPPLANEGY